MKYHIDFGAGSKLKDLSKRYNAEIYKDHIIVAIDRREPQEKDFLEIMDKHYKREGNIWKKISEPNLGYKFIDYYIVDDFRNEIDWLPLVDTWQCISTFEHFREEDVISSIEGIYNKISDRSIGHLHIDLTDHKQYPPDPNNCWYHYEDPGYARTMIHGYFGLFLNRITHLEWDNLIYCFFDKEGSSLDPDPTVYARHQLRKKDMIDKATVELLDSLLKEESLLYDNESNFLNHD